MITYVQATTDAELKAILALQQQNLAGHLSPEEISSQGFVTVVHSFEDLEKLNNTTGHVIAKDGERLVAYLLAMTSTAQDDIPVLRPMFALFRQISFNGRKVSEWNYLVVGQVCVAKAYRGQGILDNCYQHYKAFFKHRYDFAITEIAANNGRSLNAHKRIGFQEVHRYTAPDGVEWVIVLWDWN